MLVRLVQSSDLAAITRINDWYIERTSSNFNVEPVGVDAMRAEWVASRAMYPWLVAVDSEGTSPGSQADPGGAIQCVVGFAKASAWKGRCAYDWSAEVTVYVHSEHGGRGIGSMLYERLFSILRDQGYRTLLAGITQPNAASVALHEKMRMKRVGYYERVGWKFDAWHDVGHWQLAFMESDAPPSEIKSVRAVISE